MTMEGDSKRIKLFGPEATTFILDQILRAKSQPCNL